MTNGRHLSDQEKTQIVADWERTYTTDPLDTGKGGCGYPDPDMIPWWAELNAIQIMTLPGSRPYWLFAGRVPTSPYPLADEAPGVPVQTSR